MRLVLIAVVTSLVFSFAVTPWWAKWLRARGYAQTIRDADELGYAVPDHAGKKGTPSMGGVVLVAGTTALFVWPFLSLLPALAEQELAANVEKGYSMMLSSTGGGALLAALTVATFGSAERRPRFIVEYDHVG